MPSASAMLAIVEAVPIVMQWPLLRDWPASASKKSSQVICRPRTSSENFQTIVPEPMSPPRYLPLSIGPPVTMIVGRSTLAAPISCAGVVLSQPLEQHDAVDRVARGSTPRRPCSSGCGTASSSGACRSRRARSSGTPAASRRPPRRRASPTRRHARRCTLHDVSSDHELQMPITGRPSKTSGAKPSARIQLRWMKPSRSRLPNHSALRRRRAAVSDTENPTGC